MSSWTLSEVFSPPGQRDSFKSTGSWGSWRWRRAHEIQDLYSFEGASSSMPSNVELISGNGVAFSTGRVETWTNICACATIANKIQVPPFTASARRHIWSWWRAYVAFRRSIEVFKTTHCRREPEMSCQGLLYTDLGCFSKICAGGHEASQHQWVGCGGWPEKITTFQTTH